MKMQAGESGVTVGVDPFEDPKLLVVHANERIGELEKLFHTFFNDNPYTVIEDVDPDSGNILVKARFKIPPPRSRAVAFGIINDLRAALDQALLIGIEILGLSAGRNVYFPFAKSPSDLEAAFTSKRHSNIPDILRPILRSFEPYPTGDGYAGGDDAFRALGLLAGKKHKIVLSVGVSSSEMHIRHLDGGIPVFRSNPTKNEIALYMRSKSHPTKADLRFATHVCLGDVPAIPDCPVTPFLRHVAGRVEGVILGLQRTTASIVDR